MVQLADLGKTLARFYLMPHHLFLRRLIHVDILILFNLIGRVKVFLRRRSSLETPRVSRLLLLHGVNVIVSVESVVTRSWITKNLVNIFINRRTHCFLLVSWLQQNRLPLSTKTIQRITPRAHIPTQQSSQRVCWQPLTRHRLDIASLRPSRINHLFILFTDILF